MKNIHLGIEDIAFIRQHTRHAVIPKYSIIMQQGQPVQKLYFLNSGIVRLIREHDKEIYTLGIVSGNEFVSTPLYLANQKNSSCSLEALTDLDVLEWSRDDLMAIKKNVPRAHDIEMAVMDRVMNWVQDNQIDALCLTAEERYRKLIELQPEIINQVPLKYIASYLSIHQDSLSRIRKLALSRSK